MIVAEPRRPDRDDHAVETMIAQARAYIEDVAAAYEVAKDVADLVTVMATKYPHHSKLWTRQISAASAIQLRETGKTPARPRETPSLPRG